MPRNRARPRTDAAIANLYNRQDGKCYLCGSAMTLTRNKPNTATVDHVVPKARTNITPPVDNIRAACDLCNNDKGDLTEAEYRALIARRRELGT